MCVCVCILPHPDSPLPLPRLLRGPQVVQLGRNRLRQRVSGRMRRQASLVHVQPGADNQRVRASVRGKLRRVQKGRGGKSVVVSLLSAYCIAYRFESCFLPLPLPSRALHRLRSLLRPPRPLLHPRSTAPRDVASRPTVISFAESPSLQEVILTLCACL